MAKIKPKKDAKETVSTDIYRENFYKIIANAEQPLIQARIVDRYFDERNKGLDMFNPNYVQRSTIQSAASRELPNLESAKRIICIDKHYQIYTREIERAEIRRQIIDSINFAGTEVYEITEKVWAVQVKKESLPAAARLFKKYLKEYCFDVTAISKMMIIMLNCRKQHREQIKADIAEMLVNRNTSSSTSEE